MTINPSNIRAELVALISELEREQHDGKRRLQLLRAVVQLLDEPKSIPRAL